MKLSDFDYDLPPELIAQHPAPRRGHSRLMVVDRASNSIRIGTFPEIIGHFGSGDALVLNDTKVFPARLRARKVETGAHVELLLLNEIEKGTWEAMARPGRRLKAGTLLSIEGARQADTVEVVEDRGAIKTLKFSVGDVRRLCWRVGEIPLPPYIRREAESDDIHRYQTVFARREGASAAPTAGLHFTSELLKELSDKGVSVEFVTLHIGLGTFQPLEHEEVEKNTIFPERYRMTAKTARRLNEVRRREGRVIAVGTTTLRLLETVVTEKGEYEAGEGIADIFIYPGHTFRSADALITNFHLPRSSLLLLVCAFAGRDLIMRAYETAVKEQFRFYSYGDAMLIL
ncbi:MAG: tRNA preQ1(34) S-adenosylmethionine ribosyltransferase-isomerase QueA [Candidatus Abyssobacteria bacterium SURF_17]|uniref:S-adenosylmethionine:tRNA ribosyltransferase-isomerase n=1 Tax=Candidatus Abyssobacteria bacterium SURF_17 TaxID=2093361 RepID=A0A419F6L7_9BACT|nr:MAG: tRNA preQ1(34) S-adenosylmethionine ribosyltransferase-isomerase QueA [Candidatus Abyssubacteria bacterium SURF_17]